MSGDEIDEAASELGKVIPIGERVIRDLIRLRYSTWCNLSPSDLLALRESITERINSNQEAIGLIDQEAIGLIDGSSLVPEQALAGLVGMIWRLQIQQFVLERLLMEWHDGVMPNPDSQHITREAEDALVARFEYDHEMQIKKYGLLFSVMTDKEKGKFTDYLEEVMEVEQQIKKGETLTAAALAVAQARGRKGDADNIRKRYQNYRSNIEKMGIG